MVSVPIIIYRYRDMALNLDVIYKGKSPGAFLWSAHYWCMTHKAPEIPQASRLYEMFEYVCASLTALDESSW